MPADREKIRILLASSTPSRWVFTGDSITHGALHTMGWRDYTELFSERLRWEMSRPHDCVIKTAASGWRITEIDADLEASVLQYRPHVVSMACGMNDCAAGDEGLNEFASIYRRSIIRVRAASNAAVVIHTPPRILPLDEQRWPHLHSYVETIRTIAQEVGAVLVDHHAHWSEAVGRGVLPFWLSDAIHPNECGHRAMAHLLFHRLGIWDASSTVCRMFVP